MNSQIHSRAFERKEDFEQKRKKIIYVYKGDGSSAIKKPVG